MIKVMNEEELLQAAGGRAINGRYYNYVSDGWTPYQIKSGDCLSVLAAKHGTTVTRIMQVNPLIDNADVIRAGFWILLP